MQLEFDFFDLNCGEGLSMTLLLTFVFLSLILKDDNLLGFVLFNDRSGNLSRSNFRASFDTVLVRNHNNVERYGVAFVRREFLYAYNVAFRNFVLLVSVIDDSVHKFFYLLFPVSKNNQGALRFGIKSRNFCDLKKPVSIGSGITIPHFSCFRQAFLHIFVIFLEKRVCFLAG